MLRVFRADITSKTAFGAIHDRRKGLRSVSLHRLEPHGRRFFEEGVQSRGVVGVGGHSLILLEGISLEVARVLLVDALLEDAGVIRQGLLSQTLSFD